MQKGSMIAKDLVAVTTAGGAVGEQWDISVTDNISYEISWTGTTLGVLKIEASISGQIWYEIPGIAWVQPAGSPGNILVNLSQQAYQYVRMTYTRTSGTGTITSWFATKTL